jgi:hypothetical protein
MYVNHIDLKSSVKWMKEMSFSFICRFLKMMSLAACNINYSLEDEGAN